jgi:transposase
MPGRLELVVEPEERAELVKVRDHHPKPYMRERAAALLKIADGVSGRWVARYGLLRTRACDTVYGWVHRYEAEGIAGLNVKPGRGRKPAFSP